MQVDHVVSKKITLCQSIYLKKVLNYFMMTECKPASIPMDPWVANFLLPYDENADKKTMKWYQAVIGSCMWPAVHTRPNIAYSLGVLSQYCINLRFTHCNLVIQMFRYMSGTLDLGITFTPNSEDEPVGYTDSDYAKLIDS